MVDESLLRLLRDTRQARRQGPAAIERQQRARFAEMVAFARANSPYYRELYRGLPESVDDPALLPVTDKKALMARFDDWVTDRTVTSASVRAFVGNPELVGERFLGKYTVDITSGTTGTPGIFLLDEPTLAVTGALLLRVLSDWLSLGDAIGILVRGMRTSMVVATGGHFAGIVMGTRLQQRHASSVEVIAAHAPLPEMVARLDRFRPALLAAYASIGALLASKQEAGRLQIHPVLVVLFAEGLPAAEYDRIAAAFNAKVRHSYAATECTFISYSCEQGWLHVNSDWLVLERPSMPTIAPSRPAGFRTPC